MDAHWVVEVDGGPKRVNHCTVFYRGHLIVFGGYCTELFSLDDPPENPPEEVVDKPLTVCYCNLETFVWEPISYPGLLHLSPANMDFSHYPINRYGHTVVSFDNRAFLWGGSNDMRFCPILFEFDLDNKTWTAIETQGQDHTPSPRDGHTAVRHEDCFYIYGGFEAVSHSLTSSIVRYHVPTKTWMRINISSRDPQPRARDFHSAQVIKDRMYIFGGRSDGENDSESFYCPELWYFDLKFGFWSEVLYGTYSGIPPCPRRSHASFVYNNMMYICGGFNSNMPSPEDAAVVSEARIEYFETGTHFMDLFEFDPAQKHWRKLQVGGSALGPIQRRRHTMTTLPGDEIILFGGTTRCRCSNSSVPCVHTDNLEELGDLHVLTLKPNLEFLSIRAFVKNETKFSFTAPAEENEAEQEANLPPIMKKEIDRIYRKRIHRRQSAVKFA